MAAGTFASDVERVLISEARIKEIVARLGCEIEDTYKNSGRPLMFVGILKGSAVFMADLMRSVNLPLTVDFMQVSSYGAGTVSGGRINMRLDLKEGDLTGTDILVVEDILDSGNTLSFLLDYLRRRGAASVRLCVLLNKPDRRVADVHVDFEGMRIPDEFVVGYGLDFDEKYRNLPYIGVLRPEAYQK